MYTPRVLRQSAFLLHGDRGGASGRGTALITAVLLVPGNELGAVLPRPLEVRARQLGNDWVMVSESITTASGLL